MGLFEMNFYVIKNPDGSYHVQNMVMGKYGQHHVHTETDYQSWSRNIAKSNIIDIKGICGCTVKAGEVIDGYPKQLEVTTGDLERYSKVANQVNISGSKYLEIPFADIHLKDLKKFRDGYVDGDKQCVYLKVG